MAEKKKVSKNEEATRRTSLYASKARQRKKKEKETRTRKGDKKGCTRPKTDDEDERCIERKNNDKAKRIQTNG